MATSARLCEVRRIALRHVGLNLCMKIHIRSVDRRNQLILLD